jgi:hypothetical protein
MQSPFAGVEPRHRRYPGHTTIELKSIIRAGFLLFFVSVCLLAPANDLLTWLWRLDPAKTWQVPENDSRDAAQAEPRTAKARGQIFLTQSTLLWCFFALWAWPKSGCPVHSDARWTSADEISTLIKFPAVKPRSLINS